MISVDVRSVIKAWGETRALDDVSFSVGKGDLVVLLGPSWCGGRLEGANTSQMIWRVYLLLARPVYVALNLVSVSWNNFLWLLIVTNSTTTRR